MRCLFVIFLGAVLSLNPSAAKAGDFGLGIIIGAPTGVSGKYNLSPKNAIDGALAWDLGDDALHLHGDYLWHRKGDLRIDTVNLDWYFGVGGRIKFRDSKPRDKDDDFRLGVRGPIGISYTFRDPRIEVFGELALILDLIESTDLDLDGGIGARYYF